jgi:hypothetical protein
MKKILLIMTLNMAVSVGAVVWENDPNFTPEQREQARKTNERIRQRNEERETEKGRRIEALSLKYFMVIQKAKKRLKNNLEYQKELMTATIDFGTAMSTLIAKPDAKIEEYINTLNKLKEDYQGNPVEYAEKAKQFEKESSNFFGYMIENNPKHKKEFEQISIDYLIPVLAKYDIEVKKYLDEVNAVKMEYMPLEG